MMKLENPIDPPEARELLLDQPRSHVSDDALRRLLADGWSVDRICAEVRFIGEGRVRALLPPN